MTPSSWGRADRRRGKGLFGARSSCAPLWGWGPGWGGVLPYGPRQTHGPAPAAARRRWRWTLVAPPVDNHCGRCRGRLALGLAAFVVFNSNVYYVGTADGMVALYQGLPATLLGIHLSSVVESGTVSYGSLADLPAERVDAHDLIGKEEGQAFLRGLAALQ